MLVLVTFESVWINEDVRQSWFAILGVILI